MTNSREHREGRRIIVAVDDSELSITVLRHAKRHIDLTRDEVHIVHVFEPNWTALPFESGMVIDLVGMEDAETQRVWRRLDSDTPRQAERIDLRGPAASSLTGYAANVEADLIVIGNRGRGEIRSMILGSTSHGVIHDAPCDVLVVRTQPAVRDTKVSHADAVHA